MVQGGYLVRGVSQIQANVEKIEGQRREIWGHDRAITFCPKFAVWSIILINLPLLQMALRTIDKGDEVISVNWRTLSR